MKIGKLACLSIIALALGACGGKKPGPPPTTVKPISPEKNMPGDKTLYGLACEGCTDSVIVFLSNAGGDPVTYDILQAMRTHKVFGRPKIGDMVALILNKEDKKTCDMVIDINDLKGSWCYKVMPTMRPMAGMSKAMAKRMAINMPDSMKQTMMVPREYGFTIAQQYQAHSVGRRKQQSQEDNMSPVVYPVAKRYSGWRLYNGKLILISGDIKLPGMKETKETRDTAELMLMMRDSLVLKFKDHVQGYYRKADNKK